MSFCFETAAERGIGKTSPYDDPSLPTDDDFKQAEKMQLLGQITNEIAHDFNNYLQVIASAFDLVEKLAARGRICEIPRQVKRALGSVDRATALIRQLHDYSRPQAGGAMRVDVNLALESMAQLLKTTVGAAIELRFDLAENLLPIRCDKDHLWSVLLNLAVNARHAMPSGGTLFIETCDATLTGKTAGLRPGRYIGIAVSDTGTGMTADVVARAADAYFTTKPKGVGTGLGLASVRSFALRFDGHMDISSTLGEGASIKLFLPCLIVNDGAG